MAFRLAILVSGRGSNLQAIIDAVADGTLNAEITAVFSDRTDAFALERARKAGIPAHALSPKDFPARASFDHALFTQIDVSAPDLIVCAGYMRLIAAAEVTPRYGRIVNIHPSLLPLFKGLHTHQQALDAGVAEHGASVHYVTAELDGGPVIAQVRVPVLAGDSADTLAARVLECEHPLLIATLRLIASGQASLRGTDVCLNGRPLFSPLQLSSAHTFV